MSTEIVFVVTQDYAEGSVSVFRNREDAKTLVYKLLRGEIKETLLEYDDAWIYSGTDLNSDLTTRFRISVRVVQS